MKEDRFIKENSHTWMQLEATLKKLRKKGLKNFEADELDNFIDLYNRICGHLSYSATYYKNSNTTAYLNRLVASAHGYIYTAEKSNIKNILRFFSRDFPLLIRQNIGLVALSTFLFIAGFFISFLYTSVSRDNAAAFLPPEIYENVGNDVNSSNASWDHGIMSSMILTNNIRVGFMAFALGITLGIGSVWILVYNGFPLGTLAALANQGNWSLTFWSLILPHGILELFAIFVCGAAGLKIGYSLINPAPYSRKDSLIIRGKESIRMILGTIPIFIIAGLIEGFITPMNISEATKLVFSLFTLLLLVLYLYYPCFKEKKQNFPSQNNN